jgi:hypothetical protein
MGNERYVRALEDHAREMSHARQPNADAIILGKVAGGSGKDGAGGHVRITAAHNVMIGPGSSVTGGDGGPGGPGGNAEVRAGDATATVLPSIPLQELVPLQDAVRRLYDEARNIVIEAAITRSTEDERLTWLAVALWGKVPLQVRLTISDKFEPLPSSIQRGRRVIFKDGAPLLMPDGSMASERVEAREISVLRSDLDKAIRIFKEQA